MSAENQLMPKKPEAGKAYDLGMRSWEARIARLQKIVHDSPEPLPLFDQLEAVDDLELAVLKRKQLMRRHQKGLV